MPNGLRQIPRTEFGSGFDGVQTADLGTGLVLPAGNIAAASLFPSKIGLTFINKSGSTIPAGALVYTNSRDAASGMGTILPADNNVAGHRAQWITQAAILNNAIGTVGLQFTLAGQNTNAGNVGDPVWLSTAGAYTLTKPTAANAVAQQVGKITVKSATVGVVNLEMLQGAVPEQIGSNEYQPLSVGPAALSANMSPSVKSVQFVVPTTAQVEAYTIMDRAGTVTQLTIHAITPQALNGTNYVTFSVINKSNGSVFLTQAVVANSTNTGGQALTQPGPITLTLTSTTANLQVNRLDAIDFFLQITGTLPGVLTVIGSVVVAPS